MPDGGAESFYDLLLNVLTKDLGLNVSDIRGQAYDGARTMSGQLTGLQARVKQNCSDKAFYVHCCAHNLNLILMDAACCLCSAKLFFGTLETLYCFLTLSLPRFKILEEEQDNMQLESLSDTRWASRKQATEAVIQSLLAIFKSLHRIQHHTTHPQCFCGEADAEEKMLELARFYSEDITKPEDAVDEFCSFRALYSELVMDLSTDAVLPFLISNDMDRAYPHLTILHRIFKTIPISSASAERSFSRLRLIKTYLRSCMNEARLFHLNFFT